jgi:hypothetical protein
LGWAVINLKESISRCDFLIKALTVVVAVVLTYYYTWPSLIALFCSCIIGAVFMFVFCKGPDVDSSGDE